jgi:hypothetical protein
VKRLRSIAGDPYAASVAVLIAVGIAGAVGIGLGAVGIAGSDTIDQQLPYLVSGGLGGLCMVIIASGLYSAQRRRLASVQEREAMDRVLSSVDVLLDDLRDAA